MAVESKRQMLSATDTTSCIKGLNSLPENVYGSIVSCLPMKDAIFTSLISRDWRYRWRSTSNIILDKCCFPCSEKKDLKDYEKNIVNFIYHVLILHNGPIEKFLFSAPVAVSDCSSMDTWISILQNKGIKCCILDFPCKSEYKVHSNLFRLNTLIRLELSNCIVRLPSGFRGLCSLTALRLHRINFVSSSDIESIISNCQNLQRLRLVECTGFSSLKIHAPKLLQLTLSGFYTKLHIDCAPLMCILLAPYCEIKVSCDIDDGESHSIFTLLGRLPRMMGLAIRGNSLQHLPGHCGLKAYPLYPCMVLLSVYSLNFNSLKELEVFLWVLFSCPNLTRLHIKSFSRMEPVSSTSNFDSLENFRLNLSKLKFLALDRIVGIGTELKFIEFLLKNTPGLEEIQITLRADIKEDLHMVHKILKQLLSFRRASPSSQIFLKDYISFLQGKK